MQNILKYFSRVAEMNIAWRLEPVKKKMSHVFICSITVGITLAVSHVVSIT